MNVCQTFNRLYVSGLFFSLIAMPMKLFSQELFAGPELLGRPTATSITINVVHNQGMDVFVEYGTQSGVYTQQTGIITTLANIPNETVISNLTPDTRYYYRLNYRISGIWTAREEHTFHTQRSAGSGFVFTVTSDSHFDSYMNEEELYEVALNNINNDALKPDFHIDLGDAFLVNNKTTVAETRQLYLSHRQSFGIFSHSTPLFLVLGNHTNEERWNLDDFQNVANSTPVISANARKYYYLNPIPGEGTDPFYRGNQDNSISAIDGNGYLEDYYSWKWGDALFVVLDPYWYTTRKPFYWGLGGEENDEFVGNEWDWTLGYEQYTWLKNTLEQSPQKYKFIFLHHLTAGTGDWLFRPYGRGGAKAALNYEWGGRNTNGTDGFAQNRPGWEMPIHEMLVVNQVSAVFHGHDHFYAMEELDGIVYQEVPQPADIQYGMGFSTNQTDYAGGVMYPNSGHLRVAVTAEAATVDYIRAFLPGDGQNGQNAYTYTIQGGTGGNTPPVAYDQNVTVQQNTPATITLTASDADGDPLTYSIVNWPTNGTLTGTGADRTYTPFNNYTGSDSFTFRVNDGQDYSNTATIHITVIPQTPAGIMEWGTVMVGGDNTTVQLENSYTSPVIVCSVRYGNNSIPVVARVGNVSGSSFRVKLQNPSDGTVQQEKVSYTVVEEGSWNINGVKLEAQKYSSTLTDNTSSWQGQAQSYLQTYTNPVVLGQVMSTNNAGWSVFWCQGSRRDNPPSGETIITGKTVCEDTDTYRSPETIGFIVFEAGHGTIGGIEFEALLGGDLIEGVGNFPPYSYTFASSFSQIPQVAVTTMAGVDGFNGGWSQTHGADPLSVSGINLSIDEDQIRDSERQHVNEQVGYVVFLQAGSF